MVSEKEMELMSRVSLGRLVEEEESETEVEVIQDLSSQLSAKCRALQDLDRSLVTSEEAWARGSGD